MKNSSMAALALSGAMLLGTAGSASALNTENTTWRQRDTTTSRTRSGANVRTDVRTRDAQKDQKRALRQRIKLQHSEYKALRKANDPRAAESFRRYQALKAEWQRLYGGDREEWREGRDRDDDDRKHAKHDKKSKRRG